MPDTAAAVAPGKVILFGEHAINRGQPALAAAVGLYARCRVARTQGEEIRLRSGGHAQRVGLPALHALRARVTEALDHHDHTAIRALGAGDYFAPAKYALAHALPAGWTGGLDIVWESEIPAAAGLGSGGAAFTAMVAALARLLPDEPALEQRATWAHLGDVVAHGGIASALDTQTSLLGGVIRFTGQGLAAPVPAAPGLSLAIADTGVSAPTSEVNARVRRWLEEAPVSRMACFAAIGAASRAALRPLAEGDWAELGGLFTLNQLVLEKIGVSCPEIADLVDAALGAGAYGAKLSGSGGGGIVIALVSAETVPAVVGAMRDAGARVYIPTVGVPGVHIE